MSGTGERRAGRTRIVGASPPGSPSMSSFRLSGLDPEPFASLFHLDADALAARGARRCIADADHGFPCRVSLEDARRGEELLLLHWEHLPGPSPYRAGGPVFVRRGAQRCVLAPGVVPDSVSRRLISLRAYDTAALMVDAEVCAGEAVAGWLEQAFRRDGIVRVHLHNARRGCFACEAERA